MAYVPNYRYRRGQSLDYEWRQKQAHKLEATGGQRNTRARNQQRRAAHQAVTPRNQQLYNFYTVSPPKNTRIANRERSTQEAYRHAKGH